MMAKSKKDLTVKKVVKSIQPSESKFVIRKRRGRFTKTTIIKALVICKGNITDTADLLESSRFTVYRYMKNYPDIRDIAEDQIERHLDKAEQVIYDAVENDKDVDTAKWLLAKCRAEIYGDKAKDLPPTIIKVTIK